MDEFVKQYEEISRLIECRFDQYEAIVKMCNRTGCSVDYWNIDSGYIDIHWDDGWDERGTFYMKLNWLKMSEDEWQAFLTELKQEKEKSVQSEKEAATRRKNYEERKRYEELKSKFENEEKNDA